jgi:Flp pilus assembly protein TadD
MNQHLVRAQLLLEQGRYEQALAEYQQQLRDDPEDAYAIACQSLCLIEMDRQAEAVAQARRAVALSPDAPFAHDALGRALAAEKRYPDALRSAEQAIALDPHEAAHFGLKGHIHLRRYEWQAALAAANQGLAIDPEHTPCLNTRIIALTKLGRNAEAVQTAQDALARNPLLAETHASHGWTLLSAGQWKPAREHFLEALRLDPNLEWAQSGLVESIKARNPVYRLVLHYVVQMSRLPPRLQFGLIFGGLIAVNLVGQLGTVAPILAIPATCLVALYLIGVYLIWVAEPVGNLLLRLHPLGRHALSRDERRGANLIGVCYLLAAAQALVAAAGWSLGWWFAARWAVLVIPASAVFRCPRGKPRNIMAATTAALAFGGIVLPVVMLVTPLAHTKTNTPLGATFLFGMEYYWLAVGLSTWLANVLITAERR